MKIRNKVMLGLLIVGAILFASSLVGIHYFQEENRADLRHRVYGLKLERAQALHRSIDRALRAVHRYFILGDLKGKQQFFKSYREFSSRLRGIQGELPEVEGRPLLRETAERIRNTAERFFRIANPVESPEAKQAVERIDALTGQVDRLLDGMAARWQEQKEKAVEAEAVMHRRLFDSICLLILFLVSGGFFSVFYFSRLISGPFRDLMRSAQEIGNGDFSRRLDDQRKDEFGIMNRTFNLMLDAVEERESALREKNRALNAAIEELARTNERMQLNNEELESTNEELQISSEELESANEELNLSNQELEVKTRELIETRDLLQKKNEEIKRGHDFLETVINSTNSGICVIRPDFTIESANRAIQKMTGYTGSELIGSFCYEMFQGRSEPCSDCPARKVFTGGGVQREHHCHVTKDGREIISDMTATPLFGKEGQVERVIETLNDVTEVVHLTHALSEQKERMRSILMNMGEGVSVINRAHEIEFINDTLRKRFGEIEGQKCYKAFRGLARPCNGKEPCSLVEILEKGRKLFEVTKRNEDGRYYRMTSVPLANPDGTTSMIQIRQDVTDEKRLEEERRRYTEQLEELNRRMEKEVEKRTQELLDANTELRLANERLREVNREKSEFIDIAVHDLRTPLTSIVSYADLLRKYKDEPEETRMEFLGIIIQESFRMTRLINDYLDLSKLESGYVDFKEENVDMHALLEQVFQTFQVRADKKRVRLDLRVPSSLPRFVGDAERLKQVFTNLIDNAIKYTPAGGEISVQGEVMERPARFRFTVRDNGIGIDEQGQKVLFKKFGRIRDRKMKKHQGSGLGLSIVKTIVEHYRGTIHVESGKGEGAAFLITLPLNRESFQVRHASSVDSSTSELVRQIVPISREYLDRNFLCAFFGASLDIDQIKKALAGEGVPVYDFMEKEQLIFSSARIPLFSRGRFDGNHLFERVRNFYDRVVQSEWEGLLVVRDMTRLFSENKVSRDILYFEKKLEAYLSRFSKPVIQICHYDPVPFPEPEMEGLEKIHPFQLLHGKIVPRNHGGNRHGS